MSIDRVNGHETADTAGDDFRASLAGRLQRMLDDERRDHERTRRILAAVRRGSARRIDGPGWEGRDERALCELVEGGPLIISDDRLAEIETMWGPEREWIVR